MPCAGICVTCPHPCLRAARLLLRGQAIPRQTGETLARHQLSREKGTSTVDLEHSQGLREQPGSRKRLLVGLLQRRFPEAPAGRFLERLLAQCRMNGRIQLQNEPCPNSRSNGTWKAIKRSSAGRRAKEVLLDELPAALATRRLIWMTSRGSTC